MNGIFSYTADHLFLFDLGTQNSSKVHIEIYYKLRVMNDASWISICIVNFTFIDLVSQAYINIHAVNTVSKSSIYSITPSLSP